MAAVEQKTGNVEPERGEGGVAAKKSLQHAPDERLYWRVLREFKALPSEKRARDLTEGELLWCALQMELDWEEQLRELCPSCRAEAMERRCPVCGAPKETFGTAGVNENFDVARFERLKRGELNQSGGLSGGCTDGARDG